VEVVTPITLIYEKMMFLRLTWFVVLLFLCAVAIGVGDGVKLVDG